MNLAKSIAINEAVRQNPHELRKHFPDFLWVLRDMTLNPVDKNSLNTSATDYLMSILKQDSDPFGFDESASDKVGRAILTFFPTVNCIMLPPPSAEVDVMKNIEANKDKLAPGFNKEIDNFIDYIKNNVFPKKIFETGEPVTGEIMAFLTQQCVLAVNDHNNTLTLATTWDNTIKLHVAEIQDCLVKEYIAEFTNIYEEDMKGGPLEEGDSSGEGQSSPTTMLGIHHALMLDKNKKLVEEVGRYCCNVGNTMTSLSQEDVLANFELKIAITEKEIILNHEEEEFEREKVVGGVLFDFLERNKERSCTFCQKIFDELYYPIKEKVSAPDSHYNFEALCQDLNEMDDKYALQAIGPAKWSVYYDAKENIKKDKENFQHLYGYREREMKALEEAAEAQRQRQQMADEINQLRQQIADKIAENEEKVAMMKKQNDRNMKKLDMEFTRRMEIEQQKYKTFVETERGKFLATLQENSKQQQEEFMKAILQLNEKHSKLLESLIENIKKPPPPPLIDDKKSKLA